MISTCATSEPTTGLDSTAAFSIVNYISKIAKSTNVAVIMTIHQPSALVCVVNCIVVLYCTVLFSRYYIIHRS